MKKKWSCSDVKCEKWANGECPKWATASTSENGCKKNPKVIEKHDNISAI